ncbi:MAG TPA: divergent PAP2 family protein [bacterium]|nr:divergent PAP2 family protein [bacterium]
MKSYIILITPLIAAVIAQIIKVLLIRKNKMSLKDLLKFSYAGMPSGHSAFTMSLVTIIALTQGLSSPLFALSLAFAIIVINDALRLRQYMSQQGAVINILIKDLNDDQFLDEKYPLLKERIGHTKLEVMAGMILGMTIGLIMFVLI